MRYKVKIDKINEVRNIYKIKKFTDELGFTICYLSRVFTGKKDIPKSSAYAITKCIDLNAKIEDYFEEVK